MNKLAINTLNAELEASAAYCRAEDLGIEITDFAFPENLDCDPAPIISRHTKAVTGIVPLISHGPFFDLIAASRDPEIVAVARKRHSAALAATKAIGAAYYIAHTNYCPLIRNSSYRNNWSSRILDFWLPFADEAGKYNIIVCLENIWEPIPDIQAELVAAGNHPNLRASLDNGHTLVFSSIPASKWVTMLGPLLVHCHLHDNSGEFDEHKPIGDGKENWKELLSAIKKYSPQAILVAESDSLACNKLSIDRLKALA
jgi:sugar phosphate isomerase/epimerase